VECDGGTFRNPGAVALNGEQAHVEGHIFLREGFAAEGSVLLFGARVEGGVSCKRGAFNALNLNTATVKGIFDWSNVQGVERSRLDLQSASIGNIEDDEASWPEKGKLCLDGLTYGRISEGPTDAAARLRWLARVDKFTLQPYQQLAKVLRENGDLRGARAVLFEMEDRRRMEQDQGALGRFMSWVLKWTIGYGQMSWRALWWLLGLTVLGSITFGAGYLGGAIAPNEKEAYAVFQQRGYPPDYYPSFNPLAYSFEHSFPLVNLGVKDHWAPSLGVSASPPLVHCWGLKWMRDVAVCGVHVFRVSSPGLLRWCIWLQVPLGWGLATLFVAGLTGIVKSD
jgi:hypothetical protein